MPLTPKVLRRSVFAFVEENGLKQPFSIQNRLAGRKWMALFYRRHPEVARRKSQMLNPARAQKLNRPIVTEYFGKLKQILMDLNIMNQPQRIYNMDEKGCRLTLHHQQQVLSRKGAKRVHPIAPEHSESATVVTRGNALGKCGPEWIDSMPPGTSTAMTAKGSMTAVTFTIWLNHFVKFKSPGRCLLIFDGARSHLDAAIVDAAEAYDIMLPCLPSNTTHELQPLDKSVFRAFEHYWDEEVLNYWTREPERKITRGRFGHILSIIWPKVMSPANLMAGFRATGIYPFNKDVIPDVAYAPSTLTERALQTLPESASLIVSEQDDDHRESVTSLQPLRNAEFILTIGTYLRKWIYLPSLVTGRSIAEEPKHEAGYSFNQTTPRTLTHEVTLLHIKQFVNPEDIRAYPKAEARKNVRQGRKAAQECPDTPSSTLEIDSSQLSSTTTLEVETFYHLLILEIP
ncbi:hypothetical protein MML48_3g00008862 [Holotrichia oblita]|uniref:Uncharacterized protein n=1 Tax=Holotrichia oblita TaxID=644536 RepID=A0ACB9THR7_HOLOL|nr:hypothetical protein MML48_3g00008862 [Holotrichia oblita]